MLDNGRKDSKGWPEVQARETIKTKTVPKGEVRYWRHEIKVVENHG